MIEDLAEGLFKTLARGVLAIVRFIIWFSWVLMYEKVAWYLGWPLVRLISATRVC